MKTCTKCGETKPLSAYSPSKNGRMGRQAACKECRNAYQKAYAPMHAERIKEYHQDWYQKNRHAQDAKNRAWAEANPTRHAELVRNRSHRRRARIAGSVPDDGLTWSSLALRLGPWCYYCGIETDPTDRSWGKFGPRHPTVDHLIPVVRGGAHVASNVALACGRCNCAKGPKTVDEFRAVNW